MEQESADSSFTQDTSGSSSIATSDTTSAGSSDDTPFAPLASGAPFAETTSAAFAPGTTGIVTSDVTAGATTLAAGTPVKVVSGDDKRLQLTTLAGGVAVDVPVEQFRVEPGVADDDDTGKARDDVYEDYEGALWGADGPRPEDVAQGYEGDCYVMAAILALVARDPQAVKRLFNPQTANAPSYTISLFNQDPVSNTFTPVAITVDTELPSLKGSDHALAYADLGRGKSPPLWPALLEKAYAQSVTGYEREGSGGSPVMPMSAFTGVAATEEGVPAKEDVLDKFKSLERDNRAVTVDTNLGVQSTQQAPFTRADDGSYTGVLRANDIYCVLVRNTIRIDDATSAHPSSLADDGAGNITGGAIASGSVDYGSGKVTLRFVAGQEPDKPENLKATYDYEGLISSEFELYGPHSYAFDHVDGDNIVLKNPWGSHDPKPIPAARFNELFDGIESVRIGA
jgi:hypothetical protein